MHAHVVPAKMSSQTEEQESRKNRKSQKNMFHKTKLCRYFAVGKCEKGGSCNFAHATKELTYCPDLRSTKMCCVLMETGSCSDENCLFAHHEHELRKKDRNRSGKSKPFVSNMMNPRHDMASMLHTQGYSSMSVMLKEAMLVVKNTFLDVQEPSSYSARLRSHSAPSLKSRSLLA